MEELKFRLQFGGDDADKHRLPAHAGAISLEGVTWSMSLLGNYLATGRIKKRGNLSPRMRFFITPARQGSYIQDIVGLIEDPNNLFITSVAGQYAVSTATEFVNSTFKYVFREVCGIGAGEGPSEESPEAGLPSGDLEALIDAVEPSMTRAHRTIGNGSSGIVLSAGRDIIINMDYGTKRYIEGSIKGDDEATWLCRVSALNANTGNGRVYLVRLGKTVPFSVVKEPETGTYAALSQSLDAYTRGVPCDVQVVAREILAVDGRIKKLLIRVAGDIE